MPIGDIGPRLNNDRPVHSSNWKTWVKAGVLCCIAGAAMVAFGLIYPAKSAAVIGVFMTIIGVACVIFGLYLRKNEDPEALLDQLQPTYPRAQDVGQRGDAIYEIDRIPLRRRADVVRAAWANAQTNTTLSFPQWLRLLGQTQDPGGYAALLRSHLASNPLSRLPLSDLEAAAHLALDYVGPFLRYRSEQRAPARQQQASVRTEPYVVDRENVMRATKIEASCGAIVALRRKFSGLFARLDAHEVDRTLDAITQWIIDEKALLTLEQKENALLVINEKRRPEDFSNSLRSNELHSLRDGSTIGLGSLASLVWRVIDHHATLPGQTEAEITNMRHSFACNLADCIEDDGHRVCGTGISIRLASSIGGYIEGIPSTWNPAPSVNQVLNTFSQTLAGQDVSQEDLARYFAQGLQHAHETWPAPYQTEERSEFRRQLEDFLSITYDFSAPPNPQSAEPV